MQAAPRQFTLDWIRSKWCAYPSERRQFMSKWCAYAGERRQFKSKWCAYEGERRHLGQNGARTQASGGPKEAREVQRRQIHQGIHKRPEVRTATKKNTDFTCVFTAPCLGGVSLSIRLCREAARAQISCAMPKISEDWPGKCLAWKTMRFIC